MTDATAPTQPSPIVDLLKTYAPSLGQSIILLVTFFTGIATTVITQRWAHPIVEAARPVVSEPRPVPLVSAGDVDNIVNLHCSDIKSTLAEVLARLPAKRGTR